MTAPCPSDTVDLGGTLVGQLDTADRRMLTGWAALAQDPGVPVELEIVDNGAVIGTAVANRYRGDLDAAGIGQGRNGFELRLAKPLDPFVEHVITVRRTFDSRALNGAPITLEPASSVDEAVCQNLDDALAAVTAQAINAAEIDAVMQVMTGHMEQLGRARCAFREQAQAHRSPARVSQVQRALFIDHDWPRPDRDAGSQAVLSHMSVLQSLGWHVAFVPATVAHRDRGAVARLQTLDIECHTAPESLSVEQVLRSHAGAYDLVYLHRCSVAGAYVGLVRQYQPNARCICSVADLHHLRLGRQAMVEARPELLREARCVRLQEMLAIRQVDAVITHSAVEAAVLAREAPDANVHVVPWAITPSNDAAPWQVRGGLVFVAGFAHQPNADGLLWLLESVMPAVWAKVPAMTLTVAGADMPPGLRRAASDARVHLLGHVADLASVYRMARVAVAPLRFGAGLKGKVLEAWAAGLPCAMTPTAAEGLDLPAGLAADVAAEPAAFAKRILALHAREDINTRHVQAARALLSQEFSQARVTATLAAAIAAGDLANFGRPGQECRHEQTPVSQHGRVDP